MKNWFSYFSYSVSIGGCKLILAVIPARDTNLFGLGIMKMTNIPQRSKAFGARVLLLWINVVVRLNYCLDGDS